MPLLRTVLAFAAAAVALIAAVPILLVVVPLWVVSLATRAGARLARSESASFEQLTEYDPELGWTPRANLDTFHAQHVNVDVFHVRTGPDGWRGSVALQDSDIAVFGDSFAAGYGVGEREFFADLFRTPRIKSMGIGGYCQVQQLLWMKRLAGSLQQKLVVWFIYYGNDLYDNLTPDMQGYRKPFVREHRASGEWEIVSSHITPTPWPIVTPSRLAGHHYYARLADLCSDTFLSRRAYSACEFLLRAGQKVCEEAGAELVVMSVPDPLQISPDGSRHLATLGGNPETFDAGYPDRCVEAICRRLDLEFVRGGSFLEAGDYLAGDCHWNARGHRRVAGALRRLYESRRSRVGGDSLTSMPVLE
jgi:hypothetical protein